MSDIEVVDAQTLETQTLETQNLESPSLESHTLQTPALETSTDSGVSSPAEEGAPSLQEAPLEVAPPEKIEPESSQQSVEPPAQTQEAEAVQSKEPETVQSKEPEAVQLEEPEAVVPEAVVVEATESFATEETSSGSKAENEDTAISTEASAAVTVTSADTPSTSSTAQEPAPAATATTSTTATTSSAAAPTSAPTSDRPTDQMMTPGVVDDLIRSGIQAEEEELLTETYFERFIGLGEMFPPGLRSKATSLCSAVKTGVKGSIWLAREGSWIVAVSVFLLAAPPLIELELMRATESMQADRNRVMLGPGYSMAPQGAPGQPPK